MKIQFLGGAGEVTGSCFLVETAKTRFLVDCGMVQGGSDAPARNRADFGFDPASIDFVLLTHAHVDHSGLLPKLVRDGFRGSIYATTATADLLGVMLPDSAHIQESDAKRAARSPNKRISPPIYTMRDVTDCLSQVQPMDYEREVAPCRGVRCRFRDAGHILGSAIIEVWVKENNRTTKLVFSGDLGQPGRPIVRDPAPIEDADILVIESTYGDRTHAGLAGVEDEMVAIIKRTLHDRGGNVIIPAFAVGRTQQIIYQIHQLARRGRLERPKVFVDSPMATEVTRITREHVRLFDREARDLVDWHAIGHDLPWLHFTASVEESMALNNVRAGAIIISASGMCDAGRIRHHLRHNLPRRECSVLLPGYQARGTLGRRLVDGATQVRIFGNDVPVRASIHPFDGLSAHADRTALLAWTGHFRSPPAHTFVVHGEPQASGALANSLRARAGWQVTVPARGERVTLDNLQEALQ